MALELQNLAWRLHSRLYHLTTPIFSRRLESEVDIHVPLEVHGQGRCAYAISPEGLSRRSVAYSFGVGADISFDMSLIDRYGLELHAFDPTDQAAKFVASQGLPDSFHFHKWALAERDGQRAFRALGNPSMAYGPGTILDVRSDPNGTVDAFRLETIMDELGHDFIDVLKLDIEGAEFALIEGLEGAGQPIGQIALEFHPHLENLRRRRLMIGAPGWQRMSAAITTLRQCGYEVIHISQSRTELSFRRRPAPRYLAG